MCRWVKGVKNCPHSRDVIYVRLAHANWREIKNSIKLTNYLKRRIMIQGRDKSTLYPALENALNSDFKIRPSSGSKVTLYLTRTSWRWPVIDMSSRRERTQRTDLPVFFAPAAAIWKSGSWLYRGCHEFKLTKQDDWVTSKVSFFGQLKQKEKIGSG